jgi:putative restriction endonuclease
VAELADYLEISVSLARDQFRGLRARRPARGRRQVDFLPVETLLCLAASFLVEPRKFGGSTIHRVPEPVPSLARLFCRSPSSVLEKMRNLNGSRPHGAQWDAPAGARLREDLPFLSRVYRALTQAARLEGFGPDRLPDFLGIEHGGELALLGQEEIDLSVLQAELREQAARQAAGGSQAVDRRETERILLAAARVGQHVFASDVLANCGDRCVFRGFSPAPSGGKRLLLAGHIKPWKDSTAAERLDPRNGLAACPAHDIAFDNGMITVNGGFRIHLARPLAGAVLADPLTRQYYGQPPMRQTLLLPGGAQPPARRYLDWHRERIFHPWRR